MQDEHTPRRGRPPKSEVTRERRRKRTSGQAIEMKLAVNPDILDHSQFAYRFLNDKDARLLQKTVHDDWDIMTNDGGIVKEDSSDLGNAVSVAVGTKKDGSPMRAYLARKPLEWHMEDRKQKQIELDEQLDRISRGRDPITGQAEADYIPRSGIKLG